MGCLGFSNLYVFNFADGYFAAEGSPCAGEEGVTLDLEPGSSSAALTLLCLFLAITEARMPLAFCVVHSHSIMGEMAKYEGVGSSAFEYSRILTF